ncbi:MAG: CDP-glycerol glycerophosphotransferase family protein [Desulfurococcales archaeon]|nr:CDP-glycerol glycerophosphotransferase family protein [Desulfurococcales archaeon]MEB3789169.1 CDP-glycerol glycerophosphotransferase family protein [Desulfurococcales archaeon]
MNKVTTRLIQSYFLSGINYFVPKKDNKVTFISHIPFSDNPRPVFEELYEQNSYEISYLYHGSVPSDLIKKFKEMYPDVGVYQLTSRIGIKHLLRSKVIVHNDMLPLKPVHSQKIVNLWHGNPGKKTGYLHPMNFKDLYLYLDMWTSYFVVSSMVSAGIFSLQFRLDPRKYKVLGQPRLSRMLENENRAREILSEVLGLSVDNYEYLILYAPTYRYTSYYRFPDKLAYVINNLIKNRDFLDFLRKMNVLLIVQPHPSIRLDIKEELDNIKLINHHMFTIRGYIMYDSMAAFDILITDYSSIFEDYILLDRPVIFYLPDKEELDRYTGFLFNIDSLDIGDKAHSISELKKAILTAIDNPKKYSFNRMYLRKILYELDERHSISRVTAFIRSLLNNN